MQSTILLCFAAIVACSYGQVYKLKPGYDERDPIHFKFPSATWESHAGRGKVFGTLGSTDGSLFGKAGYKQDIFKDNRGHLTGQAYGSRVLGANGDSSAFGATLNWANENAKAALDVNKEIGRGSGMTLTGDGVWKLDKDTKLSAGGNLQKTFGHSKPEIGIQAEIQHDF